MERLVLVVVLVVVAVAVAGVLRARRHRPAPVRTGPMLPEQLDRQDFDRPEAPWLVAVFTAASCRTCEDVWDKARLLDSDAVAVQQVELERDRELHRRYDVGAVPATVVADEAGTVRARFVGAVTATDLWAAVAELREPGALPENGCDPAGGGSSAA